MVTAAEACARVTFPEGMKVLLVDSDKLKADASAGLLRECAYKVETCHGVEAASTLLQSSTFELAILEVATSTGQEAGDKLVDLCNQSDIPTVLMSSTVDTEAVMKGIRLGALDVLARPLDRYTARKLWQYAIRKAASAKKKGSCSEATGSARASSTPVDSATRMLQPCTSGSSGDCDSKGREPAEDPSVAESSEVSAASSDDKSMIDIMPVDGSTLADGLQVTMQEVEALFGKYDETEKDAKIDSLLDITPPNDSDNSSEDSGPMRDSDKTTDNGTQKSSDCSSSRSGDATSQPNGSQASSKDTKRPALTKEKRSASAAYLRDRPLAVRPSPAPQFQWMPGGMMPRPQQPVHVLGYPVGGVAPTPQMGSNMHPPQPMNPQMNPQMQPPPQGPNPQMMGGYMGRPEQHAMGIPQQQQVDGMPQQQFFQRARQEHMTSVHSNPDMTSNKTPVMGMQHLCHSRRNLTGNIFSGEKGTSQGPLGLSLRKSTSFLDLVNQSHGTAPL